MNLTQHAALWEKIEAFALDEPGAAITFSSKLAAQQQWSPAFTKRVIEEYRRFIFLCAVHPNGASPSNPVDEAWHLHLTYTHSYWIKLCKEILGKDIHHMPSRGGDSEKHKHDNWYRETLFFYKEVFGTDPPSDIWPQTNVNEIQEPAMGVRKELIVLVTGLLLLPFLFIGWQYDQVVPFFINGPHFLLFYALLTAVTVLSFLILQKEQTRQLHDLVTHFFPLHTTPFEAAQFLYGKYRAEQADIVDLLQRDLLVLDNNKNFVIHKNNYKPAGREKNPLVDNLLKQSEGSLVTYSAIAAGWYDESKFANPQLAKLLQSANKKEQLSFQYVVALITVAVGVARVLQGVYNGRPVSFLVTAIVFFCGVLWILARRNTRRAIIFRKARAIYNERVSDNRQAYKEDIVPAFVLNGSSAIAALPAAVLLASVFAPYTPIKGNFNDGNWGYGSDVGSSYDSNNSYGSNGSCGSSSSCSSSSCGSSGCGGCSGG